MQMTTRQRKSTVIERIADRIDLTIDLMTLGQYGLERVPADVAGERCGQARRGKTDWEASRPARRVGAPSGRSGSRRRPAHPAEPEWAWPGARRRG